MRKPFDANGEIMLTKSGPFGNTCMGKFVSSTILNVSSTPTSPATVLSSPYIAVSSPAAVVTSPPTVVKTVCVTIRGDGDGQVNFTDVPYLINHIFRGGLSPSLMETDDCNCEGVVDFTDILCLVDYIFRGGSPHHAKNRKR